MAASIILALFAISALSSANSQGLAKEVCTADKTLFEYGYNSANAIFGGILSVRTGLNGRVGCGKPSAASMQRVEAIRFAVNYLNNFNVGQGYLSGVTFGMKLYDTCHNGDNALRDMQKLFPQSTIYQPYCSSSSNKATLGIVGPVFSSVASKVAPYAKDIPSTVISTALATHLSDVNKYPTFFRTVPSQAFIMRGVASLLKKLNWKKTIILYTDDAYGTDGYDQLVKASTDFDICVTEAVKLPILGSVSDYRTILQMVGANDFVSGVISAPDHQARMILEALQQITDLQQVQWVLIDVSLNAPGLSNLKQMNGALAVMIKSVDIAAFRDYFVGLEANPSAVTDNPWFREWYEEMNQCSLLAGSPNACVLKNTATLQSSFKQDTYVLPIIKAIFAYAEAFKTVCPPGSGVCSNGLQQAPQDIQIALRSLDFTFPSNVLGGALNGETIEFDPKGDTLTSALTVFQYNDVGGAFSFKSIGEYQDGVTTISGTLKFYNQQRNGALALSPTSLCGASGCTSCILPPKRVQYQYTPGDLVIASLINGHVQTDSLFSCGSDMEKRLASIVAAQWAVGEYKRRNTDKLRGVSLGSLVANVCPTGAVAADFLNDLLGSSSGVTDENGVAISSRGNIYGFVDDTDSMMARAISPILNQYKYPEIQAGATTSSIASGDMYPYYARAVPNEKMYLTALTSLLLAKKWNHVQIATMKNQYYSGMAMRFKAYAARDGICVVSTSHLEDGASKVLTELLSESGAFVVVTFGHASYIKELFDEIKTTGNKGNIQIVSGMSEWATDPMYFDANSEPEYTITLGLRQQKNADFESYLRGLSLADISNDPFLTSLFEVTNKCSLVTTSRGMYPRICSAGETFTPYQGNAPYVIQAIYNMADKLHEIIADVCQNQNYFTLCVEFKKLHDIPMRLAQKMKNSIGINDGEGTADIVYYVVNNGIYQEFGDYDTSEGHMNTVTGNNVNLLNAKFNVATTCPGACLDCRYLYTFKNVIYQPGDVYIAGSFSTSFPGSEALQPYACGGIKTKNGPLYTLAMMYALDQVNRNNASVSAKGIKFGGLALDHCSNSGRQKLMVSDIYSGFVHPALDIDQTKILSWVIGGSGANNEAAMLLDPLGVPMISPDATSETLRRDHDNFYRTIQGDVTTSNAFVKLAKQLGFRYLQIVHSASDYGHNSKDSLISVAQSEGICVTQSLELSDRTQASDIVDKLTKKETHVVVVIMGTSSTTAMLEAITSNAIARKSLVVMLPEGFKSVVELYGNRLDHSPISLSLQQSMLPGFKAYLDRSPVENVFFAQYYMKLFTCNLEGYHLYDTKCAYPLAPITGNPQFADSIFDLSTINAVYASVDALDRTIKEYCGPDYSKPCTDYLQAPDQRQRFVKNLKFVNFIDEGQNAFRFLQREGNVAFEVMQYSKTRFQQIKVGSYAGITLNMNSDFDNNYQNVESACSLPCLECINKGLNFSLTPGDIYLGGLFDVHERSLNPFICGKIKTLHGFLLQEAFHYALSQVNSKDGQFKDILNGVQLGGIGLDACSSQVRGGQLVSNIFNNLTPLTKDALTVDPSEIDIYVGSYDSSSTRYLARILNDIEVPQISYAADSAVLSDKSLYPSFFRTVPSIVHQARAILALLDKMNIRYIQILYQDNTYGRSGMEELKKLAESYKICVAQAVDYPDLGIANLERSKAAVSRLMEKPSANTVVTFLSTSYINSLLRAVDISDRAIGKLRFVGSNVWADNKEAIQGVDTNALDSITLKLDADDVVDFERYISSKTLANSGGNPWFEEYYQEIHDCYTSPVNPYGHKNPCPQSLSSIIRSSRYQQDPNVLTVMNAVYASAFAIHKTLTDQCGDGYQSVCQSYRNNMKRHSIITKKLDDVEFVDPGGSDFKFTDREAQINFRLNAIETGGLEGINYRQIGTYNSVSKALDLKVADYKPSRQWKSGCDREDACSECPTIRDSTTRYAFYESPNAAPYNDAPVIVAFFDIHEQGVDPYRCGKLNMAGFQQFLSFLYSAQIAFPNLIKGDAGLGAYRGIRLLAVDTCSNPVRVDQDLFGLLQGTGLCNTNFDTGAVSISAGNIGSVIVSGDLNTMAVSRLLEQMGITYISPNAKSPLLDKKMHLGRSFTPISGKMRFLAELASLMDWSYMDVMYEETAMGYYPYHSLQKFAQHSSICLGQSFAIGEESTDQDIESYMEQLNGDRGSKVVVLLGRKGFFLRALKAARRVDVAEDYIWILGSGETLDKAFVESISPNNMHVKIITFHVEHKTLPGFKNFVEATTYSQADVNNGKTASNNRGIPNEWFTEFYQTMNDCRIPQASRVLNADKPDCTSGPISQTHYKEDYGILNTVLASFAASKGLHSSVAGNIALATGKKLGNYRKKIMQETMAATLSLSSIGVNTEDTFEFNSYRWWDGSIIVNYWDVNNQDAELLTKTVRGLPTDASIGELKENLNISSMCRETQKQGFCGCDYTTFFTAAIVDAPDYVPSSHRNYYKYDDDGDRVYDWPIWAITIAVLTGIGLLVTLILFLVLLCAYPKKKGTSILGYLMIVGILGIYGINFAFFVSATDTVCGVRRFMMGVVYIICFAPLLIKAMDNWRFGHVDYAERKYSGISSACALLMCAIAIILIQCIIPIMWLILEHPKAESWMYGDSRNDNDWCSPADDYDLGLVLSFGFVVFIVFMTAIFSALSYQSETNNYESRWILFSSIATAGCFLVWMIVTTNAKGKYRDPTVAIANFANATILLMAVPLRKTVLMIQAKRNKDDISEQDKSNPYDMYSESYVNPGYELSDYDQVFMEKPSEF